MFDGVRVNEDTRTIFLANDLFESEMADIITSMHNLQYQDARRPIHFIICTDGGLMDAAMAIYDTMQDLSVPVYTYSIGRCCSAGAFLLATGDKRFAYPNSRIMLHEMSTGTWGKYHDVGEWHKEMQRVHSQYLTILAEHTGLEYGELEELLKIDYWLSPTEAKELGVVDYIVGEV